MVPKSFGIRMFDRCLVRHGTGGYPAAIGIRGDRPVLGQFPLQEGGDVCRPDQHCERSEETGGAGGRNPHLRR